MLKVILTIAKALIVKLKTMLFIYLCTNLLGADISGDAIMAVESMFLLINSISKAGSRKTLKVLFEDNFHPPYPNSHQKGVFF